MNEEGIPVDSMEEWIRRECCGMGVGGRRSKAMLGLTSIVITGAKLV